LIGKVLYWLLANKIADKYDEYYCLWWSNLTTTFKVQ